MVWDKAMYYFSHENTKYEHIWYFEDDVFLFSEEILSKIDNEFESSDLLTRNHSIKNEYDTFGWWHWNQVMGKIDLPWAHSLICICRISNRLLGKVREYANVNKRTFFIESILNTLAIHNDFIIGTPIEFDTVVQGDMLGLEITPNKKMCVFHPYKDLDKQSEIREYLHNYFHQKDY